MYDAVEGQRIKDAAYAEMVADLQHAWRQPVEVPPKIEITNAPRTMTADAAQRIKDAAWLEMCRDLEGAWKADEGNNE